MMYTDTPTEQGGIERTITPAVYKVEYASQKEAEAGARMLQWTLDALNEHFDLYIRQDVTVETDIMQMEDGRDKRRWAVRARFAMTPPLYGKYPRRVGINGHQYIERNY